MFRHVVLYTWKDSLSDEEIKKSYDILDEVSSQLPGRLSFSWGKNISKEGRNKGYTHCLVADFEDEKGRDLFIEDPDRVNVSLEHFVPKMVDGVNSIISFDYEI